MVTYTTTKLHSIRQANMDKLKKLTSKNNTNVYSSSNNLIEENSSVTDDIESYTNEVDVESANEQTHSISKKLLKSKFINEKIKDESNSETSSQSGHVSKSKSQSSIKKNKSKKRKKNSPDIGEVMTIENEVRLESDESEEASEKDDKSNTKEMEQDSSRSVEKKHHSKDKISSIEDNMIDPSNDYILIGLHISRCNLLRNDLFLYGPFIKIYIVNTTNEECYNSDSNPLITGNFEFHKKRSMVPHWNETILFDKNLIEKIDNLNEVIIFFEVIDRMPDLEDQFTVKSIAWAFIKPIGFKNHSNMNKKLKLQLYIHDRKAINESFLRIYECWKSGNFETYPSALYIEIICVKTDRIESDINNIKFNIMQNMNIRSKQGERKIESTKIMLKNNIRFVKRTSKDQCELPNNVFKKIKIENGTFNTLKFSKCGNFLACSTKDQNKYIIIIYKVPEFNKVMKLQHHQNFIYDICWNVSGNCLLTASSDCIVYLWNVTNTQSVTKQKLAHPAFTYTAKFCNFNEEIIATGCYDKLIRIWVAESSSNYVLSEELEGHTGIVNSICFMENIEMFFSADSNGHIFKWAKGKSNWMKILNITIEEFKSNIINDIIIFPDGQRILVILRNHTPWALDIATSTKSICYKGGHLIKYQTRGIISPCGSMIFVGNNVWSASTGELMAVYNPIEFDHHSIISSDFHPFYNIIALSSGCENSSILLCTRDSDDPTLAVEYYSSGKFLKAAAESHSRFMFKTISQNVQAEIVDEKNKSCEFKLWGLIKKMDGILMSVKRNKYNFKIQSKNFTDDLIPMTNLHISNEKDSSKRSSSESTKNVIESSNKLQTDVNRLEDLENCQLSNTYTLKKEEKSNLKHWNYRLNDIQHEIEESSTLSNAESLEEDLNTYTIFMNK